jgi:hypothetical protein
MHAYIQCLMFVAKWAGESTVITFYVGNMCIHTYMHTYMHACIQGLLFVAKWAGESTVITFDIGNVLLCGDVRYMCMCTCVTYIYIYIYAIQWQCVAVWGREYECMCMYM